MERTRGGPGPCFTRDVSLPEALGLTSSHLLKFLIFNCFLLPVFAFLGRGRETWELGSLERLFLERLSGRRPAVLLRRSWGPRRQQPLHLPIARRPPSGRPLSGRVQRMWEASPRALPLRALWPRANPLPLRPWFPHLPSRGWDRPHPVWGWEPLGLQGADARTSSPLWPRLTAPSPGASCPRGHGSTPGHSSSPCWPALPASMLPCPRPKARPSCPLLAGTPGRPLRRAHSGRSARTQLSLQTCTRPSAAQPTVVAALPARRQGTFLRPTACRLLGQGAGSAAGLPRCALQDSPVGRGQGPQQPAAYWGQEGSP